MARVVDTSLNLPHGRRVSLTQAMPRQEYSRSSLNRFKEDKYQLTIAKPWHDWSRQPVTSLMVTTCNASTSRVEKLLKSIHGRHVPVNPPQYRREWSRGSNTTCCPSHCFCELVLFIRDVGGAFTHNSLLHFHQTSLVFHLLVVFIS